MSGVDVINFDAEGWVMTGRVLRDDTQLSAGMRGGCECHDPTEIHDDLITQSVAVEASALFEIGTFEVRDSRRMCMVDCKSAIRRLCLTFCPQVLSNLPLEIKEARAESSISALATGYPCVQVP
jgi:hypothetical protein